MTDLLYLPSIEAGYERTFRARVLSLPPGGVVLDRTLFYPTGGGQPADQGTLLGPETPLLHVRDVTKTGSTVVHRVAKGVPGGRPLQTGDTVDGAIDWERRYRHMRLHTAQHLLSALVFAETGLKTARASFAGSAGTIDLEGPWPANPGAPDLERRLAPIVESSASVGVRTVSHADWDAHPSARSGLVRIPPHVDPVRLIEIDGWDRCPCGGTHVRSTREIGAVRLGPSIPLGAAASRLPFTIAFEATSTPNE